MFGMSQQQAVGSLGPVPENPELPQSDRSSSIGDVAASDFAERYSTGDFGRDSLIEQTLTQRNQSLHDMGLLDDPTVHGTRPQYADAIEGKPSDDIMAATYWREVQAQKAQESQIQQIYKNNPQLPQISYRDAVNEASAQANSLDMQNADVTRHAGAITNIIGGFTGGAAATFTPENELQAASMALPGGPEGRGFAAIAGRVGTMALQQFGVSLATQAAVVNPSREATGLAGMSGKDMVEQALVQGVVGGATQGAAEGIHAGFRAYFPATTPTAAATVAAKLDDIAAGRGGMADLAGELKAAKTPEQAAGTMASAPLETQLDLANKAVENPSPGEKAIMQAGEQELLNEKAQPPGVTYPDHIARLGEVASAVENDVPIPDAKGALSPVQIAAASPDAPKLPTDLAGAKPRYGYGDKQFTTSFDSDVDKALFITSQAKASKRDADYRDFLHNLGFDDPMIQARGQAIRDALKAMAKDAPEGNLNVPAQTHTVPPKPALQPMRAAAASEVAKAAPVKKPSLLEFIAKEGGMKDTSGDLSSMGADAFHRDKNGDAIPYKRKLIHEDGLEPDDMALRAQEAGYFTEHGENRPTINDLYDKMDAELRGERQHFPGDDNAFSEHEQMLKRLDEEMERAGVSPNTHSETEIREALRAQAEAHAASESDIASTVPKAAAEEKTPVPEDDILQKLHEAKETDAAPINDEKSTTIKEALAEIDEHQGLLDSLRTCFIGG